MSRNKYPEKTVEKILSIAYRLFMEKGYENTTIQDITDELGMSKGAIYHHFKSKEDILDAIGDIKFAERSSFVKAHQAEGLNGLEKLKAALCMELGDKEKQQLDKLTLNLLENPRLLASMLNDTLYKGIPVIEAFIDEGIRDGSIHLEESKSAAEVLLLLTNIWLNPAVLPGSLDEIGRKLKFFKILTDGMGLPVIDDEVFEVIMNYFRQITE